MGTNLYRGCNTVGGWGYALSMPTTYSIRGERVRRLRDDLQMQQGELAEALRQFGATMNQSHLSQVERNEKGVSVETLGALADILQTSADYLIGLTDEPMPYGDMQEQVLLVEKDPERRAMLQRLFSSIERLAPDAKDEYYRALEVMYAGVVARSNERNRHLDRNRKS